MKVYLYGLACILAAITGIAVYAEDWGTAAISAVLMVVFGLLTLRRAQ
jgi:hypothetical protein